MSESLGITAGPPETVLPPAPPEAVARLDGAVATAGGRRRPALESVARAYPQWPAAWAALGTLALQSGEEVQAYAYFRAGYHRGLDALRKAGWRGSGYVRWSAPDNRGFLRCLHGLERAAAAIGEDDEAERCALFLRQLDPAWPPADPR